MKIYFDRIEELRKEKGLSVIGLCKISGISRSSFWNWKKNIQTPSKEKIKKLAEVLGVSTDKISDITDDTKVSEFDFSDSINSWQELVNLNDSGQHSKFSNFINEILSLNNDLRQVRIIIEAFTSSMDTMFYIKDTKQKYVLASKSFLKILGLNPAYNVYRKTDSDFYSKTEAKMNTQQDEEVLFSGKPVKDFESFIPGTRKKRICLISKYPIFDSSKNPIGLIGVFTDITGRKKAEEERELLFQLLDSIPYTIGAGFVDGYFYVNKAFIDIIGHPREKIYKEGSTLVDAVTHYKPDVIHLMELKSKLAEEVNANNIARAYNSNGKLFWIHNINIMTSYKNKQLGIGIARDYTEEQQKEVELAVYQRMLEKMSKNSNEIVWGFEFNKDNEILLFFLNDNFEKLSGYSKDEFLYKSPKLEASLIIDEKIRKKSILSIIDKSYHNGIMSGLANGIETENFEFCINSKKGDSISLKTCVNKIAVLGVNTSFWGISKITSHFKKKFQKQQINFLSRLFLINVNN